MPAQQSDDETILSESTIRQSEVKDGGKQLPEDDIDVNTSKQIESVEPVQEPEKPSSSTSHKKWEGYVDWDEDESDESDEFISEVTVQEEEELEDLCVTLLHFANTQTNYIQRLHSI